MTNVALMRTASGRRDDTAGQTEGPALRSHSELDAALLLRVYGEFLEMPGLRLTCRQAQRLLGLDERTCLELLECLVDAKFLCRPAHGMYTRLTDGRTHPRPPDSAAPELQLRRVR